MTGPDSPAQEALEEEDKVPVLPVDPAVLQRAVVRARQAARGNGINPHTILLNGFDGELLRFQARSVFRVKASIAEKSLPGRETHGIVCTSKEDMQIKVREGIEKTTIDTAAIKMLTVFLEHRKDKGFYIDNLVIKLEKLSRRLIFYVPCTVCSAKGKINCMQCQGAGQYNCPRCKAHRTIVCPMCRGTRVSRQKDGSTGTCRRCNGHGEAPCNNCKRMGKIRCKPCLGTGKVPCQKCAASGVVSDINQVAFEAMTRFEYDRQDMDPDVAEMMDNTGPAMATDKHADILFLHEKEQKEAQEAYEARVKADLKNDVVIPFDVALPWGPLGIRIGKNEIKGTLFGMHPTLQDYVPFLEQPIAGGIDDLARAAEAGSPVAESLFSAVRFRAVGDAVLLAATMTRHKAIEAMQKKWSLGITPEVREKMIIDADRAFSRYCRMPQIMGMLGGLFIALCFFAWWFTAGVRNFPLQYGMPAIGLVATDVAAWLAVATAVAWIIQFAVRQTSMRLFKKILPADKIGKVKPQPAKTRLVAYGGSFVLLVIILAGLWVAGLPLPEWLVVLRQAVVAG